MLTHAPAQSSDLPDETSLGLGDSAKPRAGVARIHAQFNRYVRALVWVASDALPRWKSHVAAIVFCNVVGVATTAGAVGGVMVYARAAEQNQAMHFMGLTLHIGSGLRPLLGFAAIIAGLGMVSAASIYIVDRLILQLASRYHALCAERALTIAADPLCRGWQTMEDDPPRVILARLVGGTARIMGLVLRNMLRAILPSLMVIATVIFLFCIDWGLTLALLPATLLYLLPLYLINRRVTRLQRRYREMSPSARGELGRRLRVMLDSGELEHGAAALRAETLQSEEAEGARAAFYGRLLADRRVHLLNAVFFIACLVALLIFFGVRARDHGRPWSDLIFYVLALRYAMTSLKQVTGLGAKFSRFFSECKTYARFVYESGATRERRAKAMRQPPPAVAAMRLRLGRQTRWDSPRAISASRPGVLLLVAPCVPGFADLEAVALRIERRIDEDVDLTTHGRFVTDAAEASHWASESGQTMFIAAPLVARRAVADAIDSGLRSRNLLCVIVGNQPQQLLSQIGGRETAAAAIVTDGARIVGGGDRHWLAQHLDEISAFVDEQAESLRHRGSGIDMDADDVDEDEE